MIRQIRVLIVEDSPEDVDLCIRAIRRSGLDCVHRQVETAEQFASALDAELWDIVLSDYTLPQFDAMEALRLLRAHSDMIPFIVVTGTLDEETVVECLTQGADNYVLKENLTRLGSAVKQALDMYEDRRARTRLEVELREAQKIEAIGTLAAGVAHDFNNLLSAILGYVSRIREGVSASSDALQALLGIEEVTHQAAGLTRSLLTFSRPSSGEKVPLDLGALVNATGRMLRRILPAAIEIETQFPSSGSTWVAGDATQLQQILINLGVNARDAMPDGGKLRVTVSRSSDSRPDSSGADVVEVVVEDNGTGMPQAVLDRIFEPFFTTKPRGSGTGLGMAIVQRMVVEHGGRIHVDSTEGQGTRVAITLPGCRPGPTDAGAPSEPAALPAGTEVVLLAEDHVHVQSVLAASLSTAGYEVICTSNGAEAIEAFTARKNDVRLAILDLDMPRVGGEACLEVLRTTRPDLPAILISGYVSADLEAKNLRDVTILQKPFSMATLLGAVRAAIGNPASPKA